MILAGPPRELLTRTSPLVRLAVATIMTLLLMAIVALWIRGQRLEQRLRAETEISEELAALLDREDQRSLTAEEVQTMRDALFESAARIRALEERSTARGKVIAGSERAIAFIQGSWGFNGPDGRPLRLRVGPGGEPLRGPPGPETTFDGDGPPVEVLYTGTAFVVTPGGHLLTNRHVARPWEYDAPPKLLAAAELTPVPRRFIGYLPGRVEPFELELVRASDSLDVALLRCEPVDVDVPSLTLAETAPKPGDEVIVMGYPTGMQALLARADPEAVEAIMAGGPIDFWEVALRLSAGGMIGPLATVGVVGQVTETSIVYDAETAQGGSGGPVMNLDGEVLAVNAAILPQFGGSNLGVPAAEALRLLRERVEPQ
jgi:S1-C subfamily serine protease